MMSKRLSYGLWGLLLIGTATMTTQYLPMAMMGLTVFILAYSTKGIRRRKN